jgi:hypothetical protein
LEVQGTASLVGFANNLHFDGRTDQLDVSVDGPTGGVQLARLDWRAQQARYHAALPGWDLRDELSDGLGTSFLLARRLDNDVWSYASPGASPVRLTGDGQNDEVALSSNGNLLIQKRRPSGQYVLMLFDRGSRTPRLTTSGPSDRMPSFSDARREWFFVRQNRGAIVRCATSGTEKDCREAYVDPYLPAWPVASPDGRNVAYLTWLNTPRAKLLSLDSGQAQDLGAALLDCAPIWSDNDHFWVLQASGPLREWIEIDVRSGRRSRAERVSASIGADTRDCTIGGNGPVRARFPQAHVIGRELSEIRALGTQVGLLQ